LFIPAASIPPYGTGGVLSTVPQKELLQLSTTNKELMMAMKWRKEE